MSHNDDGALLSLDDSLGSSDVLRKRGKRILHRRHSVAAPFQKRDNLAPTRSVGKGPVDEHDGRLNFCGQADAGRSGRNGEYEGSNAGYELHGFVLPLMRLSCE